MWGPLLLSFFRAEWELSPIKIRIHWCGWGIKGKERAGAGFTTPLPRFTPLAVNIVIFRWSWGRVGVFFSHKFIEIKIVFRWWNLWFIPNEGLAFLGTQPGPGLGNDFEWERSDILHFSNLLRPPWSSAFCHLGARLEARSKGKFSLTSKLSKAFMNKSPEVLVSLITDPNFPANMDSGVCCQALLLGIPNSCSCLLCLP